jgi:hypothetical protein
MFRLGGSTLAVGLRDFAGGTTAAAVAWLASRLLREMAFPVSYGVTYLVAFAFTSLGLVCFAAIREPRSPIVEEPRSFATIDQVERRHQRVHDGDAHLRRRRRLHARGDGGHVRGAYAA